MLQFTRNEKLRYKDYLCITIVGIILSLVNNSSPATGVGMIFLLYFGVDLVMIPISHLLARVLFVEETPIKVEELKHSDSQYQYIITTKKRKFYTEVYSVPRDTINVRVFSIAGKYFVEVWKK